VVMLPDNLERTADPDVTVPAGESQGAGAERDIVGQPEMVPHPALTASPVRPEELVVTVAAGELLRYPLMGPEDLAGLKPDGLPTVVAAPVEEDPALAGRVVATVAQRATVMDGWPR
jgi:hypothetical protein